MTRRERILGLVFLGCILTGFFLFGVQLYADTVRELDTKIAKAQSRKARMELALATTSDMKVKRQAWQADEAAPETFLASFERVARSAQWSTEAMIFKGKKDGRLKFSIKLSGPSSGFGRLLAVLSDWKKQVFVESIEAQASSKGSMRATIEVGYAVQ